MKPLPYLYALAYLEQHGGVYPDTPQWRVTVQSLYSRFLVYDNANTERKTLITAREVANLPVFVAKNWGEFVAGKIQREELEDNASIFDRYVKFLPENLRAWATESKAWVAGRPRTDFVLALVPGTGPHGGHLGNYVHMHLFAFRDQAGTIGDWCVSVNDCDDGNVKFVTPKFNAAVAKFCEVMQVSPFSLQELLGLDFRWDC